MLDETGQKKKDGFAGRPFQVGKVEFESSFKAVFDLRGKDLLPDVPRADLAAIRASCRGSDTDRPCVEGRPPQESQEEPQDGSRTRKPHGMNERRRRHDRGPQLQEQEQTRPHDQKKSLPTLERLKGFVLLFCKFFFVLVISVSCNVR